jgi:imidazolonepropionase-like amidohydrolase
VDLKELDKEFALVGATVIDGTGSPPKKDTTIIVKEVEAQVFPERIDLRRLSRGKEALRYGVISEIGNKDAVKLDNIQQVDASGLFVMPGLIDCHVHFGGSVTDVPLDRWFTPKYLRAIRTVSNAQKILDWGFTTVRGCGSNYDIDLKKAIEEGTIIGPRILSSGRGICRTGGEQDIRRDIYDLPDEFMDEFYQGRRCDGVEELRKEVRRMLRQGVDFIKCWVSGGGFWYRDSDKDTQFTMEELRVIVNEANMLHVPVAFHCLNIESIKMAVTLGVRTIEHCYVGEGELGEEICKTMVEKNIFIDPTLSSYYAGKVGELLITEARAPSALKFWKLALRSGVKYIMGSDVWGEPITPFGEYGMGEMKLRVDVLGMTPMEAIVSATKTASEALGIQDKVGTIEKGKIADLLIVKANPVENIDSLGNKDNILHVIKEGKLIR